MDTLGGEDFQLGLTAPFTDPATFSSPSPHHLETRGMQSFLSGLLSHLLPCPFPCASGWARNETPAMSFYISRPRGAVGLLVPACKPIA